MYKLRIQLFCEQDWGLSGSTFTMVESFTMMYGLRVRKTLLQVLTFLSLFRVYGHLPVHKRQGEVSLSSG